MIYKLLIGIRSIHFSISTTSRFRSKSGSTYLSPLPLTPLSHLHISFGTLIKCLNRSTATGEPIVSMTEVEQNNPSVIAVRLLPILVLDTIISNLLDKKSERFGRALVNVGNNSNK